MIAVHKKPSVDYDVDSDSDFYTMALTDPDAPSRQDPRFGQYLHWLVVNIPGNDIEKGQALFDYVGAGPPKDTGASREHSRPRFRVVLTPHPPAGLHRYAFLLYRQWSGAIPDIAETEGMKDNTAESAEFRPKWDARKFALKYNMGEPVGLTYFKAEYDEFSDRIFDLGGKEASEERGEL